MGRGWWGGRASGVEDGRGGHEKWGRSGACLGFLLVGTTPINGRRAGAIWWPTDRVRIRGFYTATFGCQHQIFWRAMAGCASRVLGGGEAEGGEGGGEGGCQCGGVWGAGCPIPCKGRLRLVAKPGDGRWCAPRWCGGG